MIVNVCISTLYQLNSVVISPSDPREKSTVNTRNGTNVILVFCLRGLRCVIAWLLCTSHYNSASLTCSQLQILRPQVYAFAQFDGLLDIYFFVTNETSCLPLELFLARGWFLSAFKAMHAIANLPTQLYSSPGRPFHRNHLNRC